MNIESNKKRPISKLASKIYSPEKIAEKARTDYHGDESMMQVFQNIIHDPHIVITEPDNKGDSDILYDGKNIGWMNVGRGMGWIDDKEYNKLQKYVPEIDLNDYEDEYDDEYDDYDDIVENSTHIMAEDDMEDELEDDIDTDISDIHKSIRNLLKDDEDVMAETVNAIYAEKGKFDKEVFVENEPFFELISKESAEDIALKFFNGKDLDTKGPANPNRAYFRFNSKKNIESTDDPGEIYIDEILDEVCDYIENNIDAMEYPEEIQDILGIPKEDED